MKLTLLEIVQSVLSDMNSDEVNSIDDTFESQRVAAIAKDTFYYLAGHRLYEHYKKAFQLEGIGDLTKPTHMKMPDECQEIEWITYHKDDGSGARRYDPVIYQKPDLFMKTINQRDSSQPEYTIVQDFNDVELIIRNDQQPSYWTSFDDKYVIFDSYDSDYDNTLKNSRFQCYGTFIPVWNSSDTYVPDVPDNYFSYYLTEVKAASFVKIKQIADPVEEERKTRGRMHLSARNAKVNSKQRYPNYGRKSTTTNWPYNNEG